MDVADFLREKEELKVLARKSVLFGLLPENLGKFEELVDSMRHGAGSEKFISYFIGMFKEEKRELDPVIDVLKSALSATLSE